MKLTRLLALGTALALAAGSGAVANQINGTVHITGPTHLYPTFPMPRVWVAGGTGDYVGTDWLPVTMAGFTYSPALSPDPVDPLFVFSSGSIIYSFSIYGPVEVTYTAAGIPMLTLSGAGTASITGFDDTPCQWNMWTQGKSGNFTFTCFPTVPESGLTAFLLGLGVVSLSVVARRRAR